MMIYNHSNIENGTEESKMNKYQKIHSVFKRDPSTNYKTFLEGQFSLPEFEYLQDCVFIGDEKIDGTNVRVIWSSDPLDFRIQNLEFRGKTDKAQIPPSLLEKLSKLFPKEKMEEYFPANENRDVICFYGEGFGRKIQKMGSFYIPDGVDFILFDVKVGYTWLERSDVREIARQLNIRMVPEIFQGTLWEAVEYTRAGFQSLWGDFPAEGLVLRPQTALLDRRGHRIISKVKTRDFPQL